MNGALDKWESGEYRLGFNSLSHHSASYVHRNNACIYMRCPTVPRSECTAQEQDSLPVNVPQVTIESVHSTLYAPLHYNTTIFFCSVMYIHAHVHSMLTLICTYIAYQVLQLARVLNRKVAIARLRVKKQYGKDNGV